MQSDGSIARRGAESSPRQNGVVSGWYGVDGEKQQDRREKGDGSKDEKDEACGANKQGKVEKQMA